MSHKGMASIKLIVGLLIMN